MTNQLPMFASTSTEDNLQINATFRNDTLMLNAYTSGLSSVEAQQVDEYLFESAYMTFIVAVIATLMSFFTIIGNTLVIVSFIIDKNLRKYSNYFILNLSLADLLIGLLIPPYAPFLLYNYNWQLGRLLCTIWLVLDYVVGSASVLCIVVISLDRYWMVSRGLAYISAQKISRAIFIMALVWFIAFLNYAPAIIFWELFDDPINDTRTEARVCQVGFHDNIVYLTATACVEFFLPFISICSLNLAVYLNIRKRSKGLIRTKVKLGKTNILKRFSTTKKPSEAETRVLTVLATEAAATIKKIPVSTEPVPAKTDSNKLNEIVPLNTNVNRVKASEIPAIKKDKNLKKDKKAARSLFILVFTFVVCWAPYTFLTLIKSVCRDCVKDSIYEITFWLLWFNSTLNPILYPFLHVQFRQAFHKIFSCLFCCLQKKRNSSYRSGLQLSASRSKLRKK